MKYVYLVLAVAGIIFPYSAIIAEYQATGGFDFIKMFESMYANNMTKIFAWDLAVSASVFMTFAIYNFKKVKVWQFILAILSTFMVGLSLAFPLFLFFKEINAEKKLL